MHDDEYCSGPKWRVHAHSHGNASCALFDHSHSRPKACMAPFGWGSTRQANTPCAPLGQTRELLAQAHAHIRGSRTPSGRHTHYRHQSLNADVHTHSHIFYAERIQGLQDEDSPVRQTCYSHSVSRLGRCLRGKAGPFWILYLSEHADVFTLREATRQSGASISAAFDGCG